MKAEGIDFQNNTEVGVNYEVSKLEEFDAIVLSGGATSRRKLPIQGADANGVEQAMDFLKHNNEVVDGICDKEARWNAAGKNVIVIGGGDTGSDCVGTSNRHGAKSVTNFEIMPKPNAERASENPWPYWPFTLKTSSSHEEGVDRNWSISTKEFIKDEAGNLMALKTVEIEWVKQEGKRPKLVEVEGSEKEWPCDLVLLALGFTGPEKTLSEQLDLKIDDRTNIEAGKTYQTNKPNIFVAGDMRRGQSLIVWAISEGREAAHYVDAYLMGESKLPLKGPGDLPAA
jgi:glutamate synthase (NADPH/NADH) small chain